MEAVAERSFTAMFSHKGEKCSEPTRLIIHESIHDEFLSKLKTSAEKMIVGNPLDPKTQMGAQVSQEQFKKILGYIEQGKKEGAKVVTGGAPAHNKGYFIKPTVLEGVTNQMTVAREEIFGPVVCAISFKDTNDLLKQANDTVYGLAAGVWTNDLGRGHRVARALEAGTVWVNTYRALNYAVPFGGSKASGFGRENGMDGFLEFTEPKAIWFEGSSEPVGDPFTLRT
jgi:acyl-CoA reductase-like NAD-dependent aldehyde dehydrogenase